ncbi:putative ABC transport system ATP-binding protein [Streptosporangium album]|uniref:Putative ABC transport system ATP-binding protein n=1 Tax=Streptosporangium album TaxID=47479 RepID=A0A7W7S3Z9_9ACTN|nr:ATP-binding cassette domain-containing protein [Streptosporangium album]MBB4943232.1 putative ABC transport system ATP-binding protein [Streptosporangium album]
MTELVRCENVARTYGKGVDAVVAVHGITCSLEPGAQVAVTGPSGSGKSTLLHLLAGLDRPTAGQVSWPALDDEPHGRIGLIFQGPSLLPPLDVLENVALPLLVAGRTETDTRAAATRALRDVGIGSLARKLPEELSGGQAQRVAVARVLAAAPRLILADEPTGQLDSAMAGHVIDLLVEAAVRLDAALLVSTHDLLITERISRHWEMHDGTLRKDAPCSR